MQICDAYNANRYPFPEEPARQRQMNGEVTARLRELHTTIEAGECAFARSFALHCSALGGSTAAELLSSRKVAPLPSTEWVLIPCRWQ